MRSFVTYPDAPASREASTSAREFEPVSMRTRTPAFPRLATLRIVTSFLAVVQVLLVFVLVSLVLMHSGRDAGMGGLGFTPASQGGTHVVERNLTRVTLVVSVLFFVNSIALFNSLN